MAKTVAPTAKVKLLTMTVDRCPRCLGLEHVTAGTDAGPPMGGPRTMANPQDGRGDQGQTIDRR